MGNQKQKWTSEEEEALLAGITKHGMGKWKNILRDPDFAPFLSNRSNIDLKDKWRNLNVSTATLGSKEKTRPPQTNIVSASPIKFASASNPSVQDISSGTINDDTANGPQDVKNAPTYNTLIIEAITALNDTNGSDVAAIVDFIKQKHEITLNFRRLLGTKLARLVTQGKLEKVQNCYKIKNENPLPIKTPSPKQKDFRPRHTTHATSLNDSSSSSVETVREAANIAASMIANAEYRSTMAAEAVKEAERYSKMLEESESTLQLAKEIYEQCLRGEIVYLN